jgi:NAD(P)-dependent dehydrogenase (short-subunit alcohol dehydrogenase family)
MIDFTGQVAVVTGAGRGLGRLYATDLARRGASVVVNDLGGSMGGEGSDATVADEVVAAITDAGGVAVASHDSVDSPEGGQAIVQTALDQFGRLDAVISNAGIFNSIPFEELTADDWRRMLRVHLDGGFYLAQPAYRVMKSQGYGPLRVHRLLGGDVRPAPGSALRGGEGGPRRLDQRHRAGRRTARNTR